VESVDWLSQSSSRMLAVIEIIENNNNDYDDGKVERKKETNLLKPENTF
jgi:hypothetical protein